MTAADLVGATEHLSALVRTTDDLRTDTDALAGRLVAWRDGSGWWRGPQGDDLRAALTQLADDAAAARSAWDAVGATLHRLRAQAGNLATELHGLERRREATQDTLSRLWRAARSAVEDTFDVDAGVAAEETALDQLERAIAEVGHRWHLACRAAATGLDGALAAAARTARPTGTIRLGGVVLPTGAALDLLVGVLDGQVPADADPAAVTTWWGSLTPTERRAWLRFAPQVVGNLDGVPFPTRAAANRIAMQELVDSLPPGDPLLARLRQFLLADGRVDPTRQIIVFDPTGDGRVAELFGDLASAQHLAVIVPGMGSTMDNFSTGVRGDAEALWAATPSAAVIAWTGYDAPAAIETGRVWEVASDEQAVVGGASLVPFLAAVRDQGPADLTLIGHSYGSLTVGQGLRQGAQVDRAVFVGSPGVGVEHVSEFPSAAAGAYFAGEVDGDPIATFERFGEAPTDPDFGAFAFDAGRPDAADPFARHSEYFDEGTALENLSAIVSGGTPTPDQPRPVERVLDAWEDVEDLGHQAVDVAQEHVHVPVVDPIVDGSIDVAQRVDRAVDQAVGVVAESAGHYATEGVEWAWDRGVGLASDAVDVLDSAIDRATSWR